MHLNPIHLLTSAFLGQNCSYGFQYFCHSQNFAAIKPLLDVEM